MLSETSQERARKDEMHARALASFKKVVPKWQFWLGEEIVNSGNSSALTNLPLPQVSPSTQEEISFAFSQARQTEDYWSHLRPGRRATHLRRFESLLWKYRDEILDVIQWETGKPRKDAFDEFLDVSVTLGFLVAKGPQILKTRRVPGAFPFLGKTKVSHRPVGTVGVVSPWNYPLTLAITDAAAALLAGNPVVLKPASSTPLCAIIVASLLLRTDLPPGAFQLIFGEGSHAGNQLVENADYVMFTGSTATGRQVAERCANRLIGFSGELGGKNPSIVFADADLNLWAKTAATDYFSSTGQLCVSTERVYIHDSVWDEAVRLLLQSVGKLQGGQSFSWETDFGPLISTGQASRMSDLVTDALSKGATVLAGGHPLPELGPSGFSPTLLTGVTPEMRVYKEEAFGPVVSLFPWSNPDSMIRSANDAGMGLHASIWTREATVASDLAQELKAGSVSVNGDFRATWGAAAAPIGGMRESGLGRRHGREGILRFTESQTVATAPSGGMGPRFAVTPEEWANLEGHIVRIRNSVSALLAHL